MKTKGIAANTKTDMIDFNIYFPYSLREYLSHRTDRKSSVRILNRVDRSQKNLSISQQSRQKLTTLELKRHLSVLLKKIIDPSGNANTPLPKALILGT